MEFGEGLSDPEIILNLAEEELLNRGVVRNGDIMVMTIGEPVGKSGGTNTMKIIRVGEGKVRQGIEAT